MASTGVAEASKNLEIVSHGPAHRTGYQKLLYVRPFFILIRVYKF